MNILTWLKVLYWRYIRWRKEAGVQIRNEITGQVVTVLHTENRTTKVAVVIEPFGVIDRFEVLRHG